MGKIAQQFNPKLSYMGTNKQCGQMILTKSGVVQCRESASRSSEYCLNHKHLRKKHNPILETLGAGIITGVGLGTGFAMVGGAKKIFNGKNPVNPKLSIKPEHYSKMKIKIFDLLSKHPEVPVDQILSSERARWDLYWASNVGFTNATEYHYLKDAHIDSAIKQVLREWVSQHKNPNMKLAKEMRSRYQGDVRVGHSGAAEYWRGQAAAYFTGNPGDILIRAIKKSEKGKSTYPILCSLPDKPGYSKVYKQYGEQGRGFYYVKDSGSGQASALFTDNPKEFWIDPDFESNFPHIGEFFSHATTKAELLKLKRLANKKWQNGEPGWKAGPVDYFLKKYNEQFYVPHIRSSKEARTDQILRTRDSTGRATPRKWSNPLPSFKYYDGKLYQLSFIAPNKRAARGHAALLRSEGAKARTEFTWGRWVVYGRD